MLQNRAAGRANLPWIQSAIRTLRMMRLKTPKNPPNAVDHLAANLERMARSVYPDFRPPPEIQGINPATDSAAAINFEANAALQEPPLQPPYPYPSMLFGLDASSSTLSPSSMLKPDEMEQPVDLTTPDSGWNFDFDFATADMEAFLSIDPNSAPYQLPMYPFSS